MYRSCELNHVTKPKVSSVPEHCRNWLRGANRHKGGHGHHAREGHQLRKFLQLQVKVRISLNVVNSSAVLLTGFCYLCTGSIGLCNSDMIELNVLLTGEF
jgi:hypothetical protein